MQGGAALLAAVSPSSCVAGFALASSTSVSVRSTKANCPLPLFSSRTLRQRQCPLLRAQQQEQDYVAYDEKKSVFPAEACEELGGEACQVDGVGPEVKGSASAAPKPASSSSSESGPDREYVDYQEKKTVFPGEACDDLGGEFCEPEYQSGVFPEKAAASK